MRGHGRVLEAAAHLEAVHAGHHHVEQDDVAQALLADRDGVRPVHGGDDVKILGRKLRIEQFHVGEEVVDDQDARRHLSGSLQAAPR